MLFFCVVSPTLVVINKQPKRVIESKLLISWVIKRGKSRIWAQMNAVQKGPKSSKITDLKPKLKKNSSKIDQKLKFPSIWCCNDPFTSPPHTYFDINPVTLYWTATISSWRELYCLASKKISPNFSLFAHYRSYSHSSLCHHRDELTFIPPILATPIDSTLILTNSIAFSSILYYLN